MSLPPGSDTWAEHGKVYLSVRDLVTELTPDEARELGSDLHERAMHAHEE